MTLTFQDLTHPEDLNSDLDLMNKTILNEIENYHIEKRYLHANGSILWVLLSVSLVRAVDGSPIHFVSQIQNITDQKLAELALSESKTQLELLIDSTFSATWEWNLYNDIISVGEKWTSILGYELSEVAPINLTKLLSFIHSEDVTTFEFELNKTSTGVTDSFQCEYRMRHRDGHYVWVYDTGKVVSYDADGNPSRILGTHLNISKRKLQELELVIAKEDAISAGESKGQFLANMSHEIRTPLTSILGYSESLREDDLSKEERDFALSTIYKNGNHLLRVINDILDLSKIEAGKLDVEVIATDLSEILSDVSNLMQFKAREKGLSLGFEYEYPIPKVIFTDPIRLKQILINLVGNAVKFTSIGGVKIVVKYESAKHRMLFSVIDTGIGLSIEAQSKLFQAFSQGDTSITRKFGGSGLGLVISSELARKLGGDITLQSESGFGSSFTASIDVGEIDENELVFDVANKFQYKPPVKLKVGAPRLEGRILVAEDGEDNRSLISFLLKKTGVAFTIVENGALAVKEAETGKFDLILMDIQMPVMDGYSATREIRSKGITIPIIALTANAMKADIDEAYANKCTDFLGKPFNREDLFNKLKDNLAVVEEVESSSSILGDENRNSPHLNSGYCRDEDREIILAVVDKFPERFVELVDAFESRDWLEVYRHAHSLKGATGLIGLQDIMNEAAKIEKFAKAKDVGISSRFKRLKILMEEAQACDDILTLATNSFFK